MAVNLALVIWFVLSSVFLLAVEAYTVAKGVPTISYRMQQLGRSAPLVVVVVAWIAGALLVHFFG